MIYAAGVVEFTGVRMAFLEGEKKIGFQAFISGNDRAWASVIDLST